MGVWLIDPSDPSTRRPHHVQDQGPQGFLEVLYRDLGYGVGQKGRRGWFRQYQSLVLQSHDVYSIQAKLGSRSPHHTALIFWASDVFTLFACLEYKLDAKRTPQTNYFLAFPSPELASLSAEEKEARATSIPGVLELCHNWGTEDPSQNFEGYTNGNEEGKKGFGHIAVSVDDVQKSCDRFTELGVEFKKRPEEGKMRNIALWVMIPAVCFRWIETNRSWRMLFLLIVCLVVSSAAQ
jgi:lactoylglutathione lyase